MKNKQQVNELEEELALVISNLNACYEKTLEYKKILDNIEHYESLNYDEYNEERTIWRYRTELMVLNSEAKKSVGRIASRLCTALNRKTDYYA